jgi:hypothetical protein
MPPTHPIGVARLEKRASGSPAVWQAPRAGHPLEHMTARDIPAPLDPRKHRNNAMRCVLVGEERDGEVPFLKGGGAREDFF